MLKVGFQSTAEKQKWMQNLRNAANAQLDTAMEKRTGVQYMIHG